MSYVMYAIYEGKKHGNCARVHEHGAATVFVHTHTQIRRDQYRYGSIGAASHGAIVYGWREKKWHATFLAGRRSGPSGAPPRGS